MVRAGIFIGVDQTGTLQKLNDAAAGAARMHAWALSQGITDVTHARLLTDAGGQKVTPDAIFTAITEFIDGPGLDQLIVYFAGHGVNINRSETWLLSDAPRNSNAAVNVAGSVDLARYCGIRHVVLISDACRVASDSIQAQNVRGADIFPNEGAAAKARPVDQFFACVLGRTAAEIKDPAVAAGGFSALYTNALLDALKGQEPSLLERSTDAEDAAAYLKPPRLAQYLEREVPLRVQRQQLGGRVKQDPDAILTVHDFWLSRFDPAPPARVTRAGPVWTPTPDTVKSLTDDLVQAVVSSPSALDTEVSRVKASTGPQAMSVARTVEHLATPFGPPHLESQCGIVVRGAQIVDAYCYSADTPLGDQRDLVWVYHKQPFVATVLVRFDNGTGALVPAFPDYLAALTFEDGELVDISYDVLQNTGRWQSLPGYRERATEVRSLHAVAAAASQHGRFRLDREGAINVARRMQDNKGIDPTLAVYAAYAYHDLQQIGRIAEMSDYLRRDVGATFFDVELLARRLGRRKLDRGNRVVPFLPMLGQGWALLSAHGIQLHPELQAVAHSVKDSLWTLYDAIGCDTLRKLMATGEFL